SVVLWCRAERAVRSRTFARMGVLGFPARSRTRIALTSTVTPVTLGACVGMVAGGAMAMALVAPWGLEALAGGAEIDLAFPAWLWAVPAVCALVAGVASMRGTSVGPSRLGSVLREG